ncbi:MAG TPA: cysteine desulfurase family protein [Gemmatimonadota bacterium]|nr:cysteine desulfurase family protein [Gemmatimonadota bacterium]
MGVPVYLDYSATTPLRPQVREAMLPYLDAEFGNPSSIHSLGREARAAIETARRRLLDILGTRHGRLVFTGSGSEADNLAILGFARRHPGGRVIHSSIEHKAVIKAGAALADTGYDVHQAPVDSRGMLELDALAALFPADGRPTLVSVMWANNETGVVQPVTEIGALCRQRGAVFHTDAVQAFGKLPVQPEAAGVQLLALSAHKLAGPKGTGALWLAAGTELHALVHGGGQEDGLRAGTENVAGIVGFAEAAAIAAAELEGEATRLRGLRDRLEAGLREAVPDIVANGGDAPERLPNVLNVSVPSIDIEGLLTSLDLEGICVSSGSACTTGSVEPSHVLTAMGRRGELAGNTIRLSLGWGTTAGDIECVLERFPTIVKRVRRYSA